MQFKSAEESLDYFHWRNAQYYPYISLMPVTGQDGKVVVDFGCGPGNDLVGFGVYSSPKTLWGLDVSSSSLAETEHRLKLHGIHADLRQLDPTSTTLPLESNSVDYIHTSGVLHHLSDPVALLKEFRRVLLDDGCVRVMVYNYDSLFLHLYVAYVQQVERRMYKKLPVREAFRHCTDGPDCPISNVYKINEFMELAGSCGFEVAHLGNAVSMYCMSLLPKRFDAIQNRQLPQEHRDFLANLTFDPKGYPIHNGAYAGIDGCFEMRPR